MAETYKLSATPALYPEGEYHGKLRGVTFTASSANDTREWFARNCGHFESAFSKILAPGLAMLIAAALQQGEPIEFPGEYEEHHFARGFTFEWSPIYFVSPERLALMR